MKAPCNLSFREKTERSPSIHPYQNGSPQRFSKGKGPCKVRTVQLAENPLCKPRGRITCRRPGGAHDRMGHIVKPGVMNNCAKPQADARG